MDATSGPLPALHALRKLGRNVAGTRRRRIPVALFAERASISRTKLHKIERGEPGVSAGAYATALFVLGMEARLADIADPRHDAAGRELEEAGLPKRIQLPRARPRSGRK